MYFEVDRIEYVSFFEDFFFQVYIKESFSLK